MAAQNWIMIISELRRYQGVCYKSDITVISGELQWSVVGVMTLLQVWTWGTDKLWNTSTPGVILPVFWTVLMEGEHKAQILNIKSSLFSFVQIILD